MMNIVIPMAGHGSRFSKAGYKDPKPLIPVLGQPMIELVIKNLTPSIPHRFIFICQAEHLIQYPLCPLLKKIAPGCEVIEVNEVTQGAACTVLLAKHFINNTNPLMIANCDQYVDVHIDDYLNALDQSTADGLIMTMKAHDNKWSFIELDMQKNITRVVEKEVVSDEATVGIYNYRKGCDFVQAAEEMITKDLYVNNEFYVAPAYNEMIASGKIIGYFNIGSVGAGMYGIGTPEDLDVFIELNKQTPLQLKRF
jgi:dTDP-glucose pyrophosphorylase